MRLFLGFNFNIFQQNRYKCNFKSGNDFGMKICFFVRF